MIVGVVVDGHSEYKSLRPIIDQVSTVTGHAFLRVMYADIQPLAPSPTIAKSCGKAVAQLCARGADLVVVLFDRKNRAECASDIAGEVQERLARQVDCGVAVVLKDRAYENWLVSDIDAIRVQPARYNLSLNAERAISPNRADRCDALAILKRAARSSYRKVDDAEKIMAHADVQRMAANSRSFRRFLRVAGHPLYTTQSRRPA